MRAAVLFVALVSLFGGAEACGNNHYAPRHIRKTSHERAPYMHNAAVAAHHKRAGGITVTTSCATAAGTKQCATVTGTATSSCSRVRLMQKCTTSVVAVSASVSTSCGLLGLCTTTLVPAPTTSATPSIKTTTSCKNNVCSTITGTMSTSCKTGLIMQCTSTLVPNLATSTVTPSSSAPSILSSSATSVSAADTSAPAASPNLDPSTSSSITASPNATSTSGLIPTATAVVGGATVDSRILVLARDAYAAESGYHGLEGYGIPYESVIVPQSGITLPTLNNTATHGRYSGIIIMDAISYEYAAGWASAITADQWTTIHNYQVLFNVRMVRINEYPGPDFGTSALNGGSGSDQPISISDTSDFPTANLKTGAGLNASGLWHYPAFITSTNTKAVAVFAADDSLAQSVAAVINTFSGGRQQFVWFTSWAPQWSTTCAALQHAHIHWITRGLFLGKRKTYLNVQIDDVELATDMYYPDGTSFRLRPADLDGHVAWQKNLNARLPLGSSFRLELGHNGNGDIIAATDPTSYGICNPDYAVDYPEVPDTALEFQKPLGTGTNFWPAEWTKYPWSAACTKLDPLTSWYLNTANRDSFYHVSHTFTHEEMNNATAHDAALEIQFNQAWLAQTGIANGMFSPHGIIPPAITGLHNGDVIRAWMENGITHVVGDNTRPVLRSTVSKYWPLISTTAANGYEGLMIVPRWATSIYYNCDTWECDVAEWKAISKGYGDYTDLLLNAQTVNTPYLFALMADPYMFHQANMRYTDMPVITAGTQTAKMSMVMGWVESVSSEIARVTNWPILSLKHDDFAQYFIDRMTLDQCKPAVTYTLNAAGTAIVSLTVSAENNNCAALVPVTIPSGSATGATNVDKVGSEPPIQWVQLKGSPVTLTLSTPVNL